MPVNGKYFLDKCISIIGAKNVISDPITMQPYLEDWNGRFKGLALAVLKPSTTEEVSRLIALCASHHVPIVPQGGNTSFCGGGIPDQAGNSIILSLNRMNKIREIDVENNTITVDAGVILSNVQVAAAECDRLFPLSLAAEGSCTIGGNLATNAGGVHVLRYGNMRELTLGLEVVTPTGEIWNGLRGLRKDNTGYSLKDIYIGSEGSLGVITGATLKLFTLHPVQIISLMKVADIHQVIELFELVRTKFDSSLTAFELICPKLLHLVKEANPDLSIPMHIDENWFVLIERSSSETWNDAQGLFELTIAAAVEAGLIVDAVIASSISQAKQLWSIRELVPEAQSLLGPNIKHDISLPISQLASFVEEAGAQIKSYWPDTEVLVFGHVGDGNLHYNIAANRKAFSDMHETRRHAISDLVHDLVYLRNGSMSAEHGIGQSKLAELVRRKSTVEIALMKSIKLALDPNNLMNPGKLLT
jgi:FAD/FMN-containing dehydrogenase